MSSSQATHNACVLNSSEILMDRAQARYALTFARCDSYRSGWPGSRRTNPGVQNRERSTPWDLGKENGTYQLASARGEGRGARGGQRGQKEADGSDYD